MQVDSRIADRARLRISMILPAYNEERLLGATLREVRRSAEVFLRKGWGAELIVCDNNSTDRTGEIAREAGANVVFEPVNQISRARNAGAAAASGDWLIFVDADSYPSPELFADVAEAISSGDCLAGGATVRLDRSYRAADISLRLWNALSRTFKLMAGSFIFCDANAFREVDGFSAELFVSEEIDLSRKLKRLARRRGKRVVIVHDHSVLTSARKMELYSISEYLWFLLKAAVSLGGATKRREACVPWYDGRR